MKERKKFSVVVSISLVLFLVGVLGLLLLNSKKVSDHFKEQIAFTIYINDSAKPIEIKQLQKSLSLRKETKTARFDFEAKPYVNEVFYDQPLLEILDQNIKKISQGIIGLSGLFIIIAILLINSSIRLSVYSKRLIIKTMQLVGATKSFIRRPFIWHHLRLGLLGAILASAGLGYLLYELNLRFPELTLLSNPKEPAFIFGAIFSMSILITGASTFFATQRFLNLTTDAVN